MILSIILITVVFLNLSLSFFVLSQNYFSLNNRFFSLLSFTSGLWTFSNFMTGIQPVPIWLLSTYSFGALVIGIGIIWILVVIDKTLKKARALFIISISVAFSICSYIPGFIAREYGEIYLGGVFTGVAGVGIIIYTFVFLFGAIYILWKLYSERKISSDPQRKSQLLSIFYGTLILVIISAFTSFIFPTFSIFAFSGLDSIGLLFFLLFIAYAITKQNLFDIKVLATELITFLLWIFILIRTILADNNQERILESGLFVITVVFGIFLIKSVIREVNQREKIEKLAVDLKKANTRLLELDKQKSEFVSFASHQLRAPLTAMKGYASLLIEGEFGEIKDEVRGAIKTILDSSKTLANIVDDYLNVSRIELGTMKYSFEMLDYKKMVTDVVDELKPSIQKSKLNFSLNFQPNNENEKFIIHADKDKFKQVITNLIDNSIKYTPSGSLDVSLIKNIKEKKIIFSVKDTGVGISPEAMPKLFSKFVRLDSGNKQNIYGTGLGLFVAKDIVTAHQGKIWAESDGDGKGSVFHVEMDMAA